MPNELPLPDELMHLLEKRESRDRRTSKRRQAEGDDVDSENGRRKTRDRRKKRRRKQDDPESNAPGT